MNILPFAVALPDNLDPDEYSKKYGSVALKDYLENKKVNIYEYLYNLYKNKLVIEDIESVERFKKNIFDILRKAKSTTLTEFFLKKMGVELECDVNSLIKDFGKMAPSIKLDSEKIEQTIKNKKKKKKSLKPKVYKALEVIIKSSLSSKEVLREYYRLTENRYISDAMAHCTIINQIKDEYDLIGEIDKDKISEKLATFPEALECFDNIINNRLIEDNNSEVSKDCINTIVEYWAEEERKNYLAIAKENLEESDEYLEAVRKHHKRD